MIEDIIQMEQPVLTIAIPTYNRPKEIQRQVRLLLPQLDGRVNLVVNDNCSEPSVKSYFSDEELKKFTLVRNKVNVGADANIARCFEMCETKWLWTLSDDDFVRKDSVSDLLKILEGEHNTVFLNFQTGLSFESIGFEELSVQFKSSTVFSSSFTMSSCIYNIEKLKPSLIDYYSNLSSMVGTIILVLKYVKINDDARCKFIDYSLIDSYNDEVGWDYRVFILNSILYVHTFSSMISSRKLNKTLFLGYYLTNYLLISYNRNKKKLTRGERLNLFWINIRRQGIVNAILYCPKALFRTAIYICFR